MKIGYQSQDLASEICAAMPERYDLARCRDLAGPDVYIVDGRNEARVECESPGESVGVIWIPAPGRLAGRHPGWRFVQGPEPLLQLLLGLSELERAFGRHQAAA